MSELLLNPRLSQEQQDRLRRAVDGQSLEDHIWLSTSGTTALEGESKLVALSHEAIDSASRGVVQQFELKSSDRFLLSLPLFHIGGLSISQRAKVCGGEVIPTALDRWNPEAAYQEIKTEKISILSLVPTQLHDLVQAGLKAPASLKQVFLGGGPVTQTLAERAQQLGWPLVFTYGMTETCAMAAFRNSLQDFFSPLPHIQWKIEDGQIAFKGPSLLTGYLWVNAEESRWLDPKQEGWLVSSDCGKLHPQGMELLGRKDEQVKVSGELVSLFQLNQRWQEKHADSVLIDLEDDRLGRVVGVVGEKAPDLSLVEEFNQEVLPFERIRRYVMLKKLPKTELGKIHKSELKKMTSGATSYAI